MELDSAEFMVGHSDEEAMIRIKTTLDSLAAGKRTMVGEGCKHEQKCKEKELCGEDSARDDVGHGESGDCKGVVGETDEETIEIQPASQPDFEYAATLEEGRTKSEAKLALESYGKEFGIDLQRNKTFNNMLVDFKNAF